MSQRTVPTQTSQPSLDRSKSTRSPPVAHPGLQKSMSSAGRIPQSTSSPRNGREGANRAPAPGSAAAALSRQASKAKEQQAKQPLQHAPSSSGTATPRRRKEDKKDNADVIARLNAICTDADPTKLFRNLVKVGQGFVPPCFFYPLPERPELIEVFVVERLVECTPLTKLARTTRSPSSR